MMASEAYLILLQYLSELPEPVKSAVEFALSNWSKIRNSAKVIRNYSMSLDDLPGEVWKWIEGFEELYQVSNMGRVKSFCEKIERILSPCPTKKGYYMVHLHKDGKKKNFGIHVLVARAFIPNPENKTTVNHIDGDKTNNRTDNLEWNTQKENQNHAIKTGLLKPGSRRKLNKITVEQIREVRQFCIPGDTYYGIAAFARKFGVTDGVISDIVHGKTYKNLK